MSVRTFVGYGKTAPALIYDHPVNLVSIDGVSSAAGYLQLFDNGIAAPSNTHEPNMTVQIAAAGPIPGIYGNMAPIPFNHGLGVAISSTPAVLTIASATYTYWGSVEEWEGYNVADYETVEDATMVAGPSQTVWSDPDTNLMYRLLTVTATNHSASTRYLMLFAKGTAANGDTPVAMWKVLPAEVKKLNFGSEGQQITSMDADGTTHSGCYFIWSSTQGPYLTVATGDATNTVDATFYSSFVG